MTESSGNSGGGAGGATGKRAGGGSGSGLPPFYVPGAVRVGSTVTFVSSGRRRLCGVGPRTRFPELRRRPIPQRAVGPDMVVLPLPLLRQHPRLQQAGELLHVQQLVPHLAVERLRV